MAMRHDDLTEEQLELQRVPGCRGVRPEALADPEYRAWLEENIERVNTSSAKPILPEEFLAMTEPVEPE